MNEAEVTITATIRYHKSKFEPAKTTGPPESCYPAEGGEFEWEFTDFDDVERQIEQQIGGDKP